MCLGRGNFWGRASRRLATARRAFTPFRQAEHMEEKGWGWGSAGSRAARAVRGWLEDWLVVAWGGDSPCGTDGDDGDGQGSRFWAGAQRPPHRPLETAPAGRKILAVLGRRNTDFTEKETVNCNLQLSIFSARRPLHGHARPLLTPP